MTKLPSLNILTSIIENDKSYLSLSSSEIVNKLILINDRLKEQWYKSNFTDFSIYQSSEYSMAGIYCYWSRSKGPMSDTIKWLKTIPNCDNLKIFDDYNGVGISTLNLIQNGFNNVSYMNDNECQLNAFKRLLNHYNISEPYNDITRSGKYDIVISYEIAEHFQNPEKYLNGLIDMLNPNGTLIISYSFNYPDAAGHFTEYMILGKNRCNKTSTRYVSKLIKSRCELVRRGWNGTPNYYKVK